MKPHKPHPLSETLPPMSEADYRALRADIRANGLGKPIVLLGGMILDGRHREKACIELGVEPKYIDFKPSMGDPLEFVKSQHVHRNLSDGQRAAWGVLHNRSRIDAVKNAAKQRMKAGVKCDETCRSVEQLSEEFGVSREYLRQADLLDSKSPALFRDVFEGRTPIYVAAREVRRREKAIAQKVTVKRLAELPPEARPDECKIECRDCIKFLQSLPDASARVIFADPPYNIGIDYGDGADADDLPHEKFYAFHAAWLEQAHRVLKPDGSIFVLCSSAMQWDIESMLRGLEGRPEFHRRNVIAWHETFGTYEAGNFAQCWRPILYYCEHPKKHVWHGDQILIESDRLKRGDSRANPAGKVPSNVWQFPRLVDNAAERMPGFPTQIPQALVERIVRVASDPGDLVVDPFVGSGTTAAAALKHHRRFAGCDKQPNNVKAALARAARTISERAKQ